MPPMRFQKIWISDERYESCGVMDVDNDGVLDIVSGAYWYPGPRFDRKHKIADVRAEGEYFDDFSTIAMDVNGDGYPDVITGGWWGNTLRWYENPRGATDKPWVEHIIAQTGNVETTRAWDVDGDGELELVPNTPGHALRYYKLIRDAAGKGTGQFECVTVYDKPQGHGLGFGDINGDGHGEFILAKGWLQRPADGQGNWILHEDFDLGSASIPILVADVNGDGVNELIVGQSHAYGLDWWEQRVAGGKRTWIKHPIDPFNSEYHDLFWVDIDGDGQCELVTGKRYRAHCGHDPGEYDPVGIYYFKWTGEGFAKQIIDWGHIPAGKGCGIHFQVADVDGCGRPEIVAPGKDGLCIYKSIGFAQNMEKAW